MSTATSQSTKSKLQGPSLVKTLEGKNLYCLRFDDVIMFTQPYYDIFVKLAKGGHIMEFIYFGDHGPSAFPARSLGLEVLTKSRYQSRRLRSRLHL